MTDRVSRPSAHTDGTETPQKLAGDDKQIAAEILHLCHRHGATVDAIIAGAKREARDGMANDLALLIDQECPHEPDEHAEGTCEVCDYAFAMAQMVRDYAEAADHA